MGLDPLFSPRAVAVVGASNRELTIGYRIIENLLDFGFRGEVYPVNPKGGEIRGLKAYPSILDTPDPVDVAHIVIKNAYVPACIEDCARKGVKAAIVNTAGFREMGLTTCSSWLTSYSSWRRWAWAPKRCRVTFSRLFWR